MYQIEAENFFSHNNSDNYIELSEWEEELISYTRPPLDENFYMKYRENQLVQFSQKSQFQTNDLFSSKLIDENKIQQRVEPTQNDEIQDLDIREILNYNSNSYIQLKQNLKFENNSQLAVEFDMKDSNELNISFNTKSQDEDDMELSQFDYSQTDTVSLGPQRTDQNSQNAQVGPGRPYKDLQRYIVHNENGKEDQVPEKRGIFRQLKKLVTKEGRNVLLNYQKQDQRYLDQKDFIKMCRECPSYDYIQKYPEGKKAVYYPLIGDVCYRFKRVSKQKYFKDDCGRMFFFHFYKQLESYCREKNNGKFNYSSALLNLKESALLFDR